MADGDPFTIRNQNLNWPTVLGPKNLKTEIFVLIQAKAFVAGEFSLEKKTIFRFQPKAKKTKIRNPYMAEYENG